MKQLTKCVFAILLLSSIISCSKKRDTDFLEQEQTKNKVQVLLNEAATNGFPGLSMSVATNSYSYTLFAGKAKLNAVNYDANTLNYMNSISKTFTAVAILKLKEQGLINLDTKMNQYLNPTICNNIPNGNIVTIRQLLNMKSGIPEYADDPQFLDDVLNGVLPMPSSQILSYVYNQPAHFAPGTKFEYSNTNYHLLALIIDAVTHASHHDYITNTIIRPYNLSHTYYVPQSALVAAPANTVASYSPDINPGQLTDISAIQFGTVMSEIGDDGIISTTSDIANFYKLLLQDTKILSSTSLVEMKGSGDVNVQGYYGMGLYTYKTSDGQTAVGHNGALFASKAEAWYFPEKGVTITLATNIWSIDNTDPIAIKFNQLWNKIIKTVLEAK